MAGDGLVKLEEVGAAKTYIPFTSVRDSRCNGPELGLGIGLGLWLRQG